MSAVGFLLLGFLVTVVVWVSRRIVRLRRIASALDNIPGPASSSFLQGNMADYFGRQGWKFTEHVAQDYGGIVKMHALCGERMLCVQDPKALYTVLIKEASVFEESNAFLSTNQNIYGPGLLASIGEQHRKQRKMLNPVFSAAHMRLLLPTFYRITGKLRDAISSQVWEGPQEVDMMSWMGRIALECIGQGGLGYSFDPLVGGKMTDEYGNALKRLFPTLQEVNLWRELLPYVDWIGTPSFRRMALDLFPVEAIHKLKGIIDLMSMKSTALFHAKRGALKIGDEFVVRQVGEGKDIMSILIKANMMADDADKLPDDQLIAQMSTFLLAATDTTSNALARILHNLAQYPEVQGKLRAEVTDAFKEGDLPYDKLIQLPYLDAVCRETLRLYPPVTFSTRVPREDSVLPLSKPMIGVDGSVMSEVPVPEGTLIVLGVLGANTNKARWGADALEWKPERWLSPLPSTLTEAATPGVFSHIMTFLGGKRACIGFKFSEMEMKVVLSTLISTFTFELTDKEISWNQSPVHYPSVGNDATEPCMPLKVGLVNKGQ
uniref:Cytochrome P450 n=1 Tax=Rhodonia placenta TaxID=104341 RepID=F1SY59_9APHY|nr:cytochrome P450 [Postia placenta]